MSAADKDFLEQRIDWNMANPNLYAACAILAAKGVPIGIEDIADATASKYNKIVHLESGTLKEIMNSLIKQEPNFAWEVQDGVVNVYPVRARDGILQAFLETRFKSFSAKKETGRKQIAETIYRAGEINAFLNSRKIKLTVFNRNDLYVADAIEDLNVSDTNLRNLLNRIVKDRSDSNQWLIQRTESGGIFLAF